MNSSTPKTPGTLLLHCNVSQTMEKVVFEVADGGHFGLLPPTTSAHTFERDTLSNFLF